MYRCAVETAARTPRTPCQPASSTGVDGACWACAPLAARRSAAAAAAPATSAALRERRIGIERKVARVRKLLDEARARRDHRRVVRAQLERNEGGIGEGGAKLRVRRDPADDCEPRKPGRGRRLAQPLHERAHDRALVRGRKIRSAALCLVRAEIANRVQQSGLQSREEKSRPGTRATGKSNDSGSPSRASRSIAAPPG